MTRAIVVTGPPAQCWCEFPAGSFGVRGEPSERLGAASPRDPEPVQFLSDRSSGLSGALPTRCTAPRPRDQFLDRSTKALCLIQGIISRSLAPISSIGCAAIFSRMALNEVWLTRFSSIQSRVNLPDWISARMRFISALVSAFTTRGPETYSPYSAVFDTE